MTITRHKFTHAFYFLPAVTLEWMNLQGKKEYTLGFEWLVWGFYLDKD
tara:strand:- start:22199 stop:22342 length:144 start_codon:yes stop_codon:yes gene_type:complete